jgi:hypothetical protein
LFGANAASSAAQAQAQASNRAIEAQQNQQNIIQGQLAPFSQGGGDAFTALAGLFGIGGGAGQLYQSPQSYAGIPNAPPSAAGAPGLSTPDPSNPATIGQFQQSPGYQYELGQQQRAIQQSAAGQTGALSGNMLQGLQQNAQGLASQDYNSWLSNATNFGLNNFNASNQNFWNTYNAGNTNYWNQYDAANQQQQNLYSRLLGLSGVGEGAAAQSGTLGAGIANNIGQAMIGQGNAIAAGQVGGAQALTGGINNAIGNLNNPNFNTSGSGNSSLQQLLALFSGGGGSQYGQNQGYGGDLNTGTGGLY